MSSAARSEFSTPAPAATVTAAVQRVLSENKHTITQQSPDGLQIGFRTRKTMFTWELDGLASIAPSAISSVVRVQLDTAADRPAALMDGKKNRKALDKLVEQILAALG